jgi:recombination protein RecA
VRRIATLKRQEKPFGNRVLVKIVKNKMAPPFRRAEVDLVYGEGISQELDVLDAALIYGVIQQTGAWFNFGSEKVAQGRDNCLKRFKDDSALFDKVLLAVREKMNELPAINKEANSE